MSFPSCHMQTTDHCLSSLPPATLGHLLISISAPFTHYLGYFSVTEFFVAVSVCFLFPALLNITTTLEKLLAFHFLHTYFHLMCKVERH